MCSVQRLTSVLCTDSLEMEGRLASGMASAFSFGYLLEESPEQDIGGHVTSGRDWAWAV